MGMGAVATSGAAASVANAVEPKRKGREHGGKKQRPAEERDVAVTASAVGAEASAMGGAAKMQKREKAAGAAATIMGVAAMSGTATRAAAVSVTAAGAMARRTAATGENLTGDVGGGGLVQWRRAQQGLRQWQQWRQTHGPGQRRQLQMGWA